MFLGTYFRNIDSKNRVIVPPKLKEKLGDTFYVTIGSEKNLEIRSDDEFRKYINKFEQTNALDHDVKRYTRYILGNTVEIIADKLGRFTIPEQHLTPTTINKEVVFVGVGNHIELWSAENYKNNATQSFEDEDFLKDMTEVLLKKGYKL